jgi:hypothetical protein
MPKAEVYSEAVVTRMGAVYKRAARELNLMIGPSREQEQLALCILALGNSIDNPNQLLDRAVRNYRRRTLNPGARAADVHRLVGRSGSARA